MTNRISRHRPSDRNGDTPEAQLAAPQQAGWPAQFDLPPLSAEDQVALTEFNARQQVLRDLTRGCLKGNYTGAHIDGPPGTSKSFTVVKTLREQHADWRLHQRITAKPLYLELEKHPGAVHVVDDCEQLLHEKNALTLLRSALNSDRVNGRRERRVTYSVSGSRARVLEHFFYGAIIIIGNRPLSDEKPEIRAVMSRIPCLTYSPPDREIRALMRHVARRGHVAEGGTMSPRECVEVIEYVIRLAAELQCRLDLRWTEHAYGHYLTQTVSGGVVDWRDMVKFHIMNTLTCFDFPPAHQGQTKPSDTTRKEALKNEIAIAEEIAGTEGLTCEDRLHEWETRTGRSPATYYRRLDEGRDDSGSME